MAQYQHLPIYKITYDLLVKTTEVTRHFPRDFKTFATRLRVRPAFNTNVW